MALALRHPIFPINTNSTPLFQENYIKGSTITSIKAKAREMLFDLSGTNILEVPRQRVNPTGSLFLKDTQKGKVVCEPATHSPLRDLSALIANLTNKIEQVDFKYVGIVTEIENDEEGVPISVNIQIEIDGKCKIIKKSPNQLPFKVYPQCQIIVEGVKRGSSKKLRFRETTPAKLSNNQLSFLSTL